MLQSLVLPSGARMPKYGMGTWYMGENARTSAAEVTALRAGLDAGAGMIDTAEMYANGGAERIVADAVKGRRDEVFIVSKVLPGNAGYKQAMRACERSLQRLGTDHLDLYLYHWPGAAPFEETLRALSDLKAQGKIVDLGVSNFDRDNLAAWHALDSANTTAVNQVYYNLQVRECESQVLPWCREHGIAVQAYTPLDQGGALLRNPALMDVARRLEASPAQVALAWLYAQPGVAPLPRSSNASHVRENLGATTLALGDAELAQLDRAFPAPAGPQRLPML